ncbi:MAG: DUF72 domain-containing protein [Candidatus Rokuibacteriota bacterium]
MVHVGTSGYNYPAWRGSFYPARWPVAAMLPFYAERFETVEINASFYRMPTPKTVAGWSAATPAAFVFALKVPQRITHFSRLINVDDPLRFFCETTRGLGPKLGPLLFQLPPTFRKEASRLTDVLSRVPPDLKIAFEFRHPSWFCDEVYDLLRGREAALCVVDAEDGTTPEVATAAWGYVRLRDRAYTDAELDAWATSLTRTGWREAFAYLKHEDTGLGPALAARLIARLAASALLPQGQRELQTDRGNAQ